MRLALLLGAALACGCGRALPEGLAGEIVTEDGRAGVPCALRLWRGAIRPLDGSGDPLAETHVRSGQAFEVALRPTGAADPGAGLLWLSVECEGYFVKVRNVDWSGPRTLLPALELGRVWVPRAAGR